MNNNIKKISFLLMIIVGLSIISLGCQDIENNNLSLKSLDFVNLPNIFEEESHKIEKVMITRAGDHAFYGTKLYFVVENNIIEKDSFTTAGIYSFDIYTQKKNLLFENPRELTINELMANKDCLFFRTEIEGEKVTCKLLINENELVILSNEQDIDSGFMPRRSLSDNYLAWFESTESNQNLKVSVLMLEIDSEEKRAVNDNIYIESPYYIPNIREDILSYINIKNEDYILSDVLNKIKNSSEFEKNIDDLKGLLEIELVDLKQQEKTSIPIPDIIGPIPDTNGNVVGNVISNDYYTIFYNRQKEVYVYDHEKEGWNYFNSRKEIFSLDIYKHLLIITDNRIGGIFCYNLKDFQVMRLTSELPYQGYYLTKVTIDGKLISRFGRGQDTIIIFDLEEIV